LFLIGVSATSHAQLWSGVLDPKRAADWTQAGAKIPVRNTICSTETPSRSAAQINADIAACPAGQVVSLSAGTYNLNSCLALKSNVTLRGAGADQTKLVFSNGCGGVGGNKRYAIGIEGYFNAQWWNIPPGPDGSNPANTKTWVGTNGVSGTYKQGAGVLTLGSAPTGSPNLQVGDILFLFQYDNPDSKVPMNGMFVSSCNSGCSGPLGGNVSKDGSGTGSANGTGMHQDVIVTNISGNNVTISPPLIADSFTSTKNPGVFWWGNSIQNAGVEDLFIEANGVSFYTLVSFFQAANCWETGVASHQTASRNHVNLQHAVHVTLANNYYQGSCVGGCSATTTGYQVETFEASSNLIQNNILDGGQSPFLSSVGSTGNVFAYNTSVRQTGTDSGRAFISHEEEFMYNLLEGNDFTAFSSDTSHGTQHFTTLFRNRIYSGGGNPTFDAMSYDRWHNAVGNVLGDAGSVMYDCFNTTNNNCDRFHDTIFRTGFPSADAFVSQEYGINPDPLVHSSLLRWGNYDTVTGAVRWCGNSSNTGWSSVCGGTSEIPTSDPYYPNTVPTVGDTGSGQQPLPPSLYQASQPSWWPAGKPWPPIGPDVTGGNIPGLSGHAYTIPAVDCYKGISGNIANFNASACYSSGQVPPPPAPQGLTGTAH